MKRFNQPPTILAALLALCIYAPPLGAQPVTSSVQVPLTGTVFVPLSDGSFDSVALSGMVHVFTYYNQTLNAS